MKQLIYLILLVSPFSLFAQFTDDFSDGDFTNNPTWTGDASEYLVTAGELQLFHTDGTANGASGQTFLSSAVQIADSASWEFYVRQDFSPSSSNYSRVYISSDVGNLLGPVNGYFVRMGGVSGTVDALELWRQDGTTETLLISGTPGNLASMHATRVRVERDNSGNWTLKADYTAGTTFITEGTATDNTYNTGSFLGVWCTNTATRYDKIFFDDFLIDPIFSDVIPPVLLSATAATATQVDLTFDEPLDPATAQTVTNYSIDNSIGTPTNAVLNTPTTVSLTVAGMTSGTNYTVSVTNVEDVNGNAISVSTPETAGFTYVLVVLPNPGDVLINEIFVDNTPIPVSIPNFDYVELYNRSGNFIDLSGSTFSDAATAVALPTYTMAPGEYVILCETANIPDFTPYGSVIGLNLPTLNVGGDSLTLVDGNGIIIDLIEYDIAMYQDPIKDDGGWSLELINPAVPCLGYANWIASNDPGGGTPGTQNSVYAPSPDVTGPTLVMAQPLNANEVLVTFNEALDAATAENAGNYSLNPAVTINSATLTTATTVLLDVAALTSQTTYVLTVTSVTDCSGNAIGMPNNTNFVYYQTQIPMVQDILITEIFADPTPQVGLPSFEYIELYNNSANVFDLADIEVDGGSLPSKLLLPGDYIIVCDDGSDGFSAFGDTIAMTSFPALTNAGDLITISSVAAGIEIDKVEYDISWYQDAVKDDGGWSLELINFLLVCKGAGNWIASNDPAGGTPGTQNSVYNNVPDVTGPTLLGAQALNANEILLTFDETLDSVSAEIVSNYSINPAVTINTATLTTPNTVSLDVAALTTQTTYTVTVSGVTDCSGNLIGTPNTANFVYYLYQIPAAQDILITELFADPSPVVGLPEFEFIELYNNSTNVFDLGDIEVDGGSLPSQPLLPGQYVIVCDDSSIGFSAFGDTIAMTSFPSLTNAGDLVTISSIAAGIQIDKVEYDISWYQDAAKDDGGWTLEMINFALACKGAGNWIASNDPSGGTPGAQNSVYSNAPDVTGPTLLGAQALNANEVLLTFDETLDLASAVVVGNYTINPAITINSATLTTGNTVLLDVATLTTQTTYTVAVSNVMDCSGNLIGIPNTANFVYYLFQLPAAQDILITELMADPSPVVGLPEYEYIELYNNSTKVFDLSDIEVDGNSLPLKALLPGQYVIVCDDSSIGFSAFGDTIAMASFPSLVNGGDLISISSIGAGIEIDKVEYDISWYRDAAKDDGGWSLEMINFNLSCKGSGNWIASNNPSGGTPGTQNSVYSTAPDITPIDLLSATPVSNNEIVLEFNDALDPITAVDIANYSGIPNLILAVLHANNYSVTLVTSSPLVDQTSYTVTVSNLTDCVGNSIGVDNASFIFIQTVPASRYDILINEFMADVSPDPLGLPDIEYIELYNRTQGKAFNLDGMKLEGRSLPFYILEAGEYVIIHKSDTTFGPAVPAIPVSTFASITDAGEDLVLLDNNGSIIDALVFDLTWYDDQDKNDGGWALERGNPNRPCEQGVNWHVSIDLKGGTPGAQNSIWVTDADATLPDLINVYPLNDTLLELTFSEALDPATAIDPANYIVDNGIGMVDSAVLQPILFNTVLVYLPTPIVTGTTYTITVDPLDCTGNAMGMFNSQQFALFELTNAGDLLINELLADPLTGGKDFVEVYNNSQKVLSLKDLFIASKSDSGNIANQELMDVKRLIFPGEFFAFTEDRGIVLGDYETPSPNNVVNVDKLPTFKADEGDVVLFTNGQIIDEFHYTEDYHNALVDNSKGVSLERIDYNTPTQQPSNWHSAASHVGFATPAYQNSQYLEIDQSSNVEVSLESETVSPDEDGYQDYLLINYNLSEPGYLASVKVFDAKGRFVKQISNNELLGTSGSLKWDGDNYNGEKARLGIYIIVGELFNPNGNVSKFKETCVVAGRL